MEMVTRLLEAAPNPQRPDVALLWSEANSKLQYRPGMRLERTTGQESADDQELRERLAERLKKPIEDVWVEPWSLGNVSDTKRVQIEFGDQGTLQVIASNRVWNIAWARSKKWALPCSSCLQLADFGHGLRGWSMRRCREWPRPPSKSA